MTLGLLDLSIVTERLLTMLERSPQNPGPPFTTVFTGLRPDDPRIGPADCQISLYLFQVAPDKFYRNTFPLGGRARPVPEQPLALTLNYLLSVRAEGRFDRAQQAMGIALKCLHDHAIVTSIANPKQLTVTMEPQSVDEIGRLWQSLATPLQLSAVYRVSVIFLEPELPMSPPEKLVLRPNVDAIKIASTPQAVTLEATVSANGLARITGAGFVAETLEAQIGGYSFQLTETVPPEAGRFCVVSSPRVELQLQFPPDTPTVLRGKYLLRLRLDRDLPTAEVWLDVP